MRLLKGRNRNAASASGIGAVDFGSANLVIHSQALENASWTVSGVTVTADQVTAPDGTLTADLVSFATTGNYIFSNIVTSVAGPYTVSFYAMAQSGTQSSVRFALRGSSGGSVVAQTTPTLTTSWQRVVVTGTPGAGSSIVAFIDSTSGAQAAYVWGVQLQVGSLGPYRPVP